MKRILTLSILLLFFLSVLSFLFADDGKKQTFGAGITMKENVSVDKLLENPSKFEGKKIVVEGKVVDVCRHKGCWIELTGEKKGQTLFVKAEDGEIVFPGDIVNKKVLVEGIVEKKIVESKESHKEHKEGDEKCKYEEEQVRYQIKCLGAQILD